MSVKRVFWAGACVLALLAGSVSPATAHEGADGRDPDDAFLPDGVSQPVGDDAVAEMRNDPDFGGAWISDGDLVVALVEGAAPDAFSDRYPLASVRFVEGRSHSYSELNAFRDKVFAELGRLEGDLHYASVAEREGIVEVGVDASVLQLAQSIDFGDGPELRFVASLPFEANHGDAVCSSRTNCDWVGGDNEVFVATNVGSGICSTGGVYRDGSDYFVLTAAHCGGVGATSGTISLNGAVIGDFHDTSWNSGSSFSVDVMSFRLRQPHVASRHLYSTGYSSGYVDVASWDGVVSSGETICLQSRGFAGWNCGTVSTASTTVNCNFGASSITLTNASLGSSLFAVGGDSGSAIWGNGQHRGVLNCSNGGGGVVFSAPAPALSALGEPLSSGHVSYKPHVELRNRAFDRPAFWSDWRQGGSGQRARYSNGYQGAWTTEFNCFTNGCSVYQDTTVGAQGYNPGDRFDLQAIVKCNSTSTCSVTLAMWIDPNVSPSLAGATSVSIAPGQWKTVSLTATVPGGVSSNQARWELYNNSGTGKNVRFSFPLMSRY